MISQWQQLDDASFSMISEATSTSCLKDDPVRYVNLKDVNGAAYKHPFNCYNVIGNALLLGYADSNSTVIVKRADLTRRAVKKWQKLLNKKW